MLLRLEEESVVPVLGPDLLWVRDGGRETLLYPLVAKRLAESLGVSGADLPAGGELHEAARRYLAKSQDAVEIYRSLRVVFRDLEPIPIPEPLVELARISKIQLFVTTTFDVMTERAVDQERFEGQRRTLGFAYAPNDKEDLPPEFDRLNLPAVFHLMGRLSGTPHSYALTRGDTLAFVESLQSRAEDSPGFLLDKLRRSDLLFLGCRDAEWLARLLTRNGRGEVFSGVEGKGSAVLFVHRFGGRTETYPEMSAPVFVSELHRRWAELPRADVPEPEPPELQLLSSPEAQSGVVFLSCAAADRDEAESLRDSLDRAGVDVLLHCDDRPLGDKWERKLRGFLSGCALYVPLISARSLGAKRRFFKATWTDAVGEAAKAAPSGRFVLPVVLDDTTPRDGALPKEFGDLRWEKNAPELVTTVVELQRNYRSARSA